jgi:hypothetical protein
MTGKHFKGPVNEQVFREHPIVNRLHDDEHEYDITGKHVDTFTFDDRGTFSHLDYSTALLIKLTSLSQSRLPEFLEHQFKVIEDHQLWLKDLEALVENNAQALEAYKPGVVKNITAAIQNALQTEKVNKSPQVSWKGSQAELLELIVSLVEAGRITDLNGRKNTASVIRAFEDMLGIKINDEWKKIDKFKTRKRSQTPFLNVLTRTFEQWVSPK